MSQERSEALVLRGVDFSETSRIVTLLSPHRGRLTCMAKGARRFKGGAGGSLDTFNRVEVVYYWKEGRSVQILGDITVIDSFQGLKHDLNKSVYAALPLEMAYKIAHENEPSEALFQVLVHGFGALEAWQGDARTHCMWQVFGVLSAAGFEPSLESCCACGEEVAERPGFSFDGGVTCPTCECDLRLNEDDYAALRKLGAANERCPDITADRSAFTVLRRFAARHLDSELRSARVIEQIFES